MDEAALAAIAGPAAGRQLHHLANNRDPRRVRAGNRRRTFGAQSALGRRPRSPEALDSVLVGLVDRVTRRMRAKGRAGRTVVLRLRFGDYATAIALADDAAQHVRLVAGPGRRARPCWRRPAPPSASGASPCSASPSPTSTATATPTS